MTKLTTGMIQIRECKAKDFDGVVALLGQLWPGKQLDPVSLRCVYDRSLASDRQVYLCAESGQRVVGFGSLTIKSNLWSESFVGYVDEMIVEEGTKVEVLAHRFSTISFYGRASADAIVSSWTLPFIGRMHTYFTSGAASRVELFFTQSCYDAFAAYTVLEPTPVTPVSFGSRRSGVFRMRDFGH